MGQSNSSQIIDEKCENYSDYLDDYLDDYESINEGLDNPDSGG